MIEKRLTKRGDPRYEVRVRGTDGKERSRTFRTKKEADRYEREQQAAIDKGTWIDPRSGRTTVKEWTTEWQRTVVHLRPKTVRIYDGNIRNHIVPTLGDYELSKLTPSMLRGWVADLTVKANGRGSVLAANSVGQAYRTLNRVLSAAVEDDLIGRNPLRGVKPPRTETQEMRFLSHDDVATLVAAVDEQYRALVLVAAYCGLRAGELMALRRSQVDLLRRTITVVEQVQYLGKAHVVSAPKSAAGRRAVSMPEFVAVALDDHLAARPAAGPEGLVFQAPEGGRMRPENFRKRIWTPAVRRAGLAPLRLHDLRHTCASLAIAAGADVKVLQRMLGHASAALTLDRYGHLLPGQAESIADRLDEMAKTATPRANAPVESIADAASSRAARGA